ncbi:MAG: hypothetical protein WCI03_08730 [bacterium]
MKRRHISSETLAGIWFPTANMDKKSLFWSYGHTPVETVLKHRFHSCEHVKL